MKKALKCIFILLLFCSFHLQDEKVYVCSSSASVAYHETTDCRGLNRCTHKIICVTRQEAVKTCGKRACRTCY